VRWSSRVGLLAGCLLFLTPLPSAAEWQFVPFVGWTFKGMTTLVDSETAIEKRHWHFGGAVTWIGNSPLGVEAYFVETPEFFHNGEVTCNINTCVTSGRPYALMANVVLATPRRWNQYGLRPYLSGGLGVMHMARNDAQNIFPMNLNMLGMNAGGGAVGFLSDRIGVRFELRYFRKIHGPDVTSLDSPVSIGPIQLRYWTMSFGVVFKK
jgi:hypothetical protein